MVELERERELEIERQREDLVHHSKGKYFSPFKVSRWHSGKESPANTEDSRDTGSILESGRCPGGGHGNILQYSCPENPMDHRAWWAIVHRVTKHHT